MKRQYITPAVYLTEATCASGLLATSYDAAVGLGTTNANNEEEILSKEDYSIWEEW